MLLGLELAGLIAVALAARSASAGRLPLRATTAWLAAAAAGVAFWVNAGPDLAGLIRDHARDSRLSAAAALALPGGPIGAREDVLAWAQARLPPGARVYLACPQPASCSNPLANWIGYRLLPRVLTDVPAQADWVLFYRTRSPAGIAGLTQVLQFAPGFAIARRG